MSALVWAETKLDSLVSKLSFVPEYVPPSQLGKHDANKAVKIEQGVGLQKTKKDARAV